MKMLPCLPSPPLRHAPDHTPSDRIVLEGNFSLTVAGLIHGVGYIRIDVRDSVTP